MSLSFQEIILRLQDFWAKQGCAILQPYDTEVGAGTLHPATTLRSLGPKPWRTAYVQPSRRPGDGRPQPGHGGRRRRVLAAPGRAVPQPGARVAQRPRPGRRDHASLRRRLGRRPGRARRRGRHAPGLDRGPADGARQRQRRPGERAAARGGRAAERPRQPPDRLQPRRRPRRRPPDGRLGPRRRRADLRRRAGDPRHQRERHHDDQHDERSERPREPRVRGVPRGGRDHRGGDHVRAGRGAPRQAHDHRRDPEVPARRDLQLLRLDRQLRRRRRLRRLRRRRVPRRRHGVQHRRRGGPRPDRQPHLRARAPEPRLGGVRDRADRRPAVRLQRRSAGDRGRRAARLRRDADRRPRHHVVHALRWRGRLAVRPPRRRGRPRGVAPAPRRRADRPRGHAGGALLGGPRALAVRDAPDRGRRAVLGELGGRRPPARAASAEAAGAAPHVARRISAPSSA